MAITNSDYPCYIAKEVLLSRARLGTHKGTIVDQHGDLIEELKEAFNQLHNQIKLSLHVLLVDISNAGDRIRAQKELEVWTFELDQSAPVGALVGPALLKQAILSKLYFSPLKSWFSQIGGGAHGQFQLSFKLSKHLKARRPSQRSEIHHFAACCLDHQQMRITYEWLRREEYNKFIGDEQEGCLFSPTPASIESDNRYQCLPTLVGTRTPKSHITQRSSPLKPNNLLDRHLATNAKISSSLFEAAELRLPIACSKNVTTDNVSEIYENAHQHIYNLQPFGQHSDPVLEPRPSRINLNSSPIPHPERIRCINNRHHPKGQGLFSSSARLLCNFEESALNGCLEQASSVGGFQLQVVAGVPAKHITLPVRTHYFNTMTGHNVTPSLHMGYCNLPKRLRIARKSNIQAVLFNPQGSIVNIFLVNMDISDMPPNCHTFIRQRTYSSSTTARIKPSPLEDEQKDKQPQNENSNRARNRPLRFLIHFRILSDTSGYTFLHSDIKMLFSNKANDLEGLDERIYKNDLEYRSASSTIEKNLEIRCEMPNEPKYSPIK